MMSVLYLVFVAVLVNLEMGGDGSDGVKSNARDRKGQKVGGCGHPLLFH